MSFWVYMLRCSDGSYYTGHTDSLECRIAQHFSGAIPSCYTFNRRPLVVVFSQEFPTREEALASEQQIKGWGRKKKEVMIRGDWAEVTRLARSSFDGLRTNGSGTPNSARPNTTAPVRGEPVEP
jgi:predicted GIY-YIG superfamily endonuclease